MNNPSDWNKMSIKFLNKKFKAECLNNRNVLDMINNKDEDLLKQILEKRFGLGEYLNNNV